MRFKRTRSRFKSTRSPALQPGSRQLSCPWPAVCGLTVCGLMLLACLLSLAQGTAYATSAQSSDYSRAEALVRNHQWADGLALLLPLLKGEPRNLKALNLAGLAYIGEGDTKQATVYFSRALTVSPGFVPALKNLAIGEFNQHQYALAEKHLLAAAKESPADPIVNLYLGEVYYGQQKYGPATARLAEAGPLLSRDSNVAAHLAISYLRTGEKEKSLAIVDRLDQTQLSPQSQFALGLALEQTDMPERSVPYLQAVSRQYPDSYDAGFDLAVTLVVSKQYPETITIAKAMIERGQETSELDNVLAEAYEGDKQTQAAVDALRRAIALDPNDAGNYLDFATLCMNHRAFDDGLAVVRAGLQVHPTSDRLIFVRGVLYAMQDRFDLAEKDFQEAASLAPQDSYGYVGLGVTYIETGNAKQAIQVLRQRLRDKPDDASLQYLLGEGLLKSGAGPGDKDYIEAQSALEKSVRLNPGLCLPHVSLGAIYLREDRLPEAVSQFELARTLDPKETSAYSHLAVAYRRLGQADKAREAIASLKDILEQQRAGSRERVKSPTVVATTKGDQP